MRKLLLSLTRFNIVFWSKVVYATSLPLESICAFRIITGLFLLFFATPNFLWLSEVPHVFFQPPILSVAFLADDFPEKGYLYILNILLILSSFNITLGIKTRLSTFLYLISFIFLSSFQFSLGKIDHTSLLLLAMLFCLAFSDWGHLLAIIPDKQLKNSFNTRSLSLLSVLICFGFFSAGFDKALHWINYDFSTSGSIAWYYKQQRNHLLGPFIPGLVPFLGFKIVDYIVVAFELSPLIFLLSGPKAWRLWLIGACVFHFCNTVFLNINFSSFALAYLAFANFSFLYKWLERRINKTFLSLSLLILAWVLVYRIVLLATNTYSSNLFVSDDDVEGTLYFASAIWMGSIFLLISTAGVIYGRKVSPK